MSMNPQEIKQGIHWVGAVDWNIRDFHGYSTYNGTTYNSYLLLDEKKVLFDTVKSGFEHELLERIGKLIDPSKIDYIVLNHIEMDHTGALPAIIDAIKPEKIFCSSKGKEVCIEHFHREDWPFYVVKNGEEISFGKHTVKFIETRMIHWPDSMFSYIKEAKLLISSDGFGQHWATSERFDDEVDIGTLMKHAAKYYANILLLYSKLIGNLLDTVSKSGLEIDMIAPDHGLIWRKEPGKIVEAYKSWSAQKTVRKALVVYDTMWKSTKAMAEEIAGGISAEGVSVKVMNLKTNHRSDIMEELLDAAAIVVGSSTLNNNMLPTVADLLTYIKGLKPKGRIGAAFGSYGWSGESVNHINDFFEQMEIEIVDPGIKVKYVPDREALDKCFELGRKIGQAIVAK